MRCMDILLLYFLQYFQFQAVKLITREYKQININKFNHKSHYLNQIIYKYLKNNFDYDYDDWEDNEGVIDYEQTSLNNNESIKTTTTNDKTNNTDLTDTTTNTTVEKVIITTIISNTTEKTDPTDTTILVKVQDTVVIATNVVANETVDIETTVTKSLSITDIPAATDETTLTLPDETENLLQLFVTSNTASDTSVPPFDLETFFPGTTFDILNFTTPYPTTTKNTFLDELKETRDKEGLFTSSLIVLFRILSKKNPKEISPLLATLNLEIERLNTEDKLLIFGGTIAEVFQAMVQMLGLEPPDVMLNHFKYAVYALEYRRTILKEDTNTLIDITDTIYIDTDIDNIAKVLKDISNYPNSTESAKDITHTALQAFIYTPFVRIEGTARERLLMTELNSVIRKRLYPGEDFQ